MSKQSIHVMTPSEIKILQMGMEDPDYITGYWFRAPGREHGWLFDNNFDPEGAWQKRLYHAKQSNAVIIGGVGTGKTLGAAMAACCWSLTTEGFKFLNVAQKEWQAKLMYEYVLDLAQDTPFSNLIFSSPQRPYPKIIIKFRIGRSTYTSSMEFMSVDRDARGIFSWRGDWINVEEAGLLDNLGEIAENLSTRLTGSTKAGRPYLGRFSFISNPWETPHLWYLFDLATEDPENSLSIVISTRHNHNVTDQQIINMLKHIPEEERGRFLDGDRPEGKGNYFSKESIYKCEDKSTSELVKKWVADETPGYKLYKKPRANYYHMEMKPHDARMYFILGDPGAGESPERNAPCIMVWDVTSFPTSPMRMVAFWWGSGFGRISPFIDKLMEFEGKYHPFFIGIDSTGPQKSLAELVNIQHPDNAFAITGLDFSGPKKSAYLVAARLVIENGLASWPDIITGMRAQLANYDPMKDQGSRSKIPQDLVATFAMSAFAVRSHFGISFEEYLENSTIDYLDNTLQVNRSSRLASRERQKRTVAAR